VQSKRERYLLRTRRCRATRYQLVAVAWAAAAVTLAAASAKADDTIKNLAAIKPVMACSSLVGLNLSGISGAVGGTITIKSATIVPAGGSNPAEYCAVTGNIGPGTNTIVMRLPTQGWTQRYVQTGCGGLCGSANINYGQSLGCIPVTNGQAASATTDMGGPGAPTRFYQAPQAQIDFAYRGMHVTAEVAKAIITKFYGRKPLYSYFTGCSDGGREALMEAQRYPNDFDGIAAGAPANNLIVQNTYHHAWRVLANQATWGDFNSFNLLSTNLSYVHSKVVKACDAQDGVVDGVIDDPRACNFDTNTLVCAKNGNEAGCLTQAQADSVRKLHDGAVTPDGDLLEPHISTEWGSELDWTIFVPNAQGQVPPANMFVTGFAGYLVWFNTYYPNFQMTDLKFTVPGFKNTVQTSVYLSAENPDLRGFAASGGKLLLYHGWADQHISPQGTLKYWKTLNEVMGDDVVERFARFYLFPGMAHCGGGTGPNQFDVLTPLMSWVELGTRPHEIVASLFDSSNNVTRTRPVFPYPTVARYSGKGSTDVAANFIPYAPRHEPHVGLGFVGNYLFSPGYPQEDCRANGTTLVCYDTRPFHDVER
jgi:Tannase and feruloyl esterase